MLKTNPEIIRISTCSINFTPNLKTRLNSPQIFEQTQRLIQQMENLKSKAREINKTVDQDSFQELERYHLENSMEQ